VIKVSQGCLGEEELAAVADAFAYGYFGMAHRVDEFEQALREYLGCAEVVTVNSGTAALHLALTSLGIGPGDEVVVPSLTFVACFQAIAMTGAVPVSCDVEPDTLLIDLADAERRLTDRTRAIVPVHFAGNPCDLDALLELGGRYGVRVVEDAAHAFGSTFGGRRIGAAGEIACFSFDSIKTITCTEGGAVACSDPALAATMRTKRLLGVDRHGAAGTAASRGPGWRFEVTTQGFRYHLSNVNAAIGLAQLRKIDGFAERRREIARRYDTAFRELPEIEPLNVDYAEAVPHIYVVRVGGGHRDELMAHLGAAGIETAVSYIPNHLHPYFGGGRESLPETERAFDEILTLPLHCALSDDDVACVISHVRAFAPVGAAR